MRFRAAVIACVLAGCAGRPAAPAARDGVDLWFAGDVHLGDSGTLGTWTRAFGAGVVNLEGPIGGGASTEARLVNSVRAVEALQAAGVAVAGLANNHEGDLGVEGAQATEAALQRGGVAWARGAKLAAVGDGMRIAVAAWDLSQGVPAELEHDLRAARASADALVVTFHVLGPPSYLPTPELRAAVEVALAAGASVVVAHGTHALARVERRGRAVIAWGLGNFAFACPCGDSDEGLVLRVHVGPEGAGAAEVIPLDPGSGPRPPQPAADAALVFDVLRGLESTPELVRIPPDIK